MDAITQEWTPQGGGSATLTARVALLPGELAGELAGGAQPDRAIDQPDDVFSRPRRRRARRLYLMGAVGLAFAAALGSGGYRWWMATRFLASTSDAYLQSDSVTVSPQVGGTIATLEVRDNQPVRAGQVLARIDARPYQAAFDKAKAAVASAKAQLSNVGAQIGEQAAKVVASRAVLTADRAAVGFARADAQRYARLGHEGFGTVRMAERTAAALSEAEATLARDQAGLTAAERQITVLASDRRLAAASLKGAEAALETARLNLSYTVIKAPFAGVVGDRGVRLGAYVQPGTPLLKIVPMGRHIYVTANFKETDLAHMRAGDPVTLSIDSFPGHSFHGTVQSLAPGSGAEFALLPPENATGNFTKIVQRVPVKIALSANDPLVGELRPGLSAEATVNTAPQTAPSAEQVP